VSRHGLAGKSAQGGILTAVTARIAPDGSPVEVSSRRGNRQLNKVIHVAARTQIRLGGPGRVYYDRKLAEGKSNMEALRALKRQLSDVIYRRHLADQRARQAVRGGQTGDTPKAA
jgi:hypothetical protein